MAGSEVNQYGVLQLPDDEEVYEQQLLVMKEELEMLKQRRVFQETKKELDRQRAKVESLKGKNAPQNAPEVASLKEVQQLLGKLNFSCIHKQITELASRDICGEL
ncbi:hypothetical protein DPMN_171380 [Dreissena polymorpha]|uniref:Uncharacterized protein n=1 Tax=Dreissena polymorpha TaxID=45954 RepID=A0A9D4E110_DREPO|nr:hypothetical protein DPMN_171380 [Dreissena polymorpha]